MNPYHVLGVRPDADIAALRAAYRQLVRVHHPDCAPDEAARVAATERMVAINWAWHIVSDAQRRADFDARWRTQQIEAARRQQEAIRAQARGQAVRGQQAHLADVLKAQAQRRQQQNRQVRAHQAAAQQAAAQADSGAPQPSPQQTASERASASAREQQFLDWQALERARREREVRARDAVTRPVRQRLSREEKKRQALARARLRRIRREDQKRSATPSARRQLAEAARLFGQEGRASEAIAICHEVLRVDFRNVPARELLGDFYLSLGRSDRALPLWEQALALQPDNAAVRRKLSALHPHDPKSYRPQPQIPRAAPKGGDARFSPARDSFWVRLREAFRGGL